MKILQMSYSVFTKHSLEPLFAQASNECYSTVHSVDKVVSRRNRKQHLNLVLKKTYDNLEVETFSYELNEFQLNRRKKTPCFKTPA